MTFTDTQRKRRGHAFLPPKAVQKKTPALMATDSVPLEDKTIHVHWFVGGWDWYAFEVNWETGEAFGLVKSPFTPEGELGYFDLAEIEALPAQGFRGPVERDTYWAPVKVGSL